MTESMVDRVARAIEQILRNPPSLALDMYGRVGADWVARAAIEAMREPSEGMMDAGMTVGSFPMCDGEVRVRYEAMIEAALK